MALKLSHVNMVYYDLQITLQYGFALIMHHYVPLLSNTRQCMLPSAILRHCVPQPREIVADFSLPHAIIATMVFRYVRTIKNSLFLL
jgi:hypothetical protein